MQYAAHNTNLDFLNLHYYFSFLRTNRNSKHWTKFKLTANNELNHSEIIIYLLLKLFGHNSQFLSIKAVQPVMIVYTYQQIALEKREKYCIENGGERKWRCLRDGRLLLSSDRIFWPVLYLSASNLISATEQKSCKDRQVWVWLIMRPFDFALFNL